MSSVERDRLAELRDAFERRSSRRGLAAARQLVQVYDGGAIPTTVPKMFLARPTGNGTAETEGASAAISADFTQTIPVLVLGPQVPVAGSNLVATVIGGRWVAESQGGAASPCIECGPCCVPKTDLIATSPTYGAFTLHYVPGVLDGTGLAAATWDWYTDCFNYITGQHARFVFGCNDAGGYASAVWVWAGSCTLGPPEAWGIYNIIFPWVCDPLSYQFNTSGDPDEPPEWTITAP